MKVAQQCGIPVVEIAADESYTDPTAPFWVLADGTKEFDGLCSVTPELARATRRAKSGKPMGGLADLAVNDVAVDKMRNNSQKCYGRSGGQNNKRDYVNPSNYCGSAIPDIKPNSHKMAKESLLGEALMVGLRTESAVRANKYNVGGVSDEELYKEIPGLPPTRAVHPAIAAGNDWKEPSEEHVRRKHELCKGTFGKKGSDLCVAFTSACILIGGMRADGKEWGPEDDKNMPDCSAQKLNKNQLKHHWDTKNSQFDPDIITFSYCDGTPVTINGVDYYRYYRYTMIFYDRKAFDDFIARVNGLKPIHDGIAEYVASVEDNPVESYRASRNPSDFVEGCGRDGVICLVDKTTSKLFLFLRNI